MVHFFRRPARLTYRAWRYRLRQDRWEIRYLLRTLRAGDVAVDIGAHKGAYTYWMAKCVGPTGQVFAFEPQADLASRLRADLALLFGGTVVVEGSALSQRAGPSTLHVPSGGSSPGATLELRHWPGGRTTTVGAVTLDGYFEARTPRSRIGLIKCDVEGHELEVFRGGERTLREHRPALIFECEERHRADGRVGPVFDYLQHLGYHGYFFGVRGQLQSVVEFRPEVHADEHSRYRVNNFVFLSDGASSPG